MNFDPISSHNHDGTNSPKLDFNNLENTDHDHDASDVTSGTFGTARLGSGTASTRTFLRGDGTWAGVGDSAPDSSWFGTYFTSVIVPDPNLGWTFGGGTTTKAALMTFNETNPSSYMYIGLQATTGLLSFGAGIDLKLAYIFYNEIASSGTTPHGGTDQWYFHGLTNSATDFVNVSNLSRASEHRVGFIHYNDKIYAVTSDGTSITSTEINENDAEDRRHFMIDFSPTSCRFYQNGTLVATHTTNIPSIGNMQLAFISASAAAPGSTIGVSPITISQTLS